MRAPIASPDVPPNWISGPSRPSEPPHTIAHHDAADFTDVTTIDRRARPSATASMTSLTPPPPRLAIVIDSRPPANAPNIGTVNRHHHAAFSMASTTFATPVTPRSTSD